MSEDVVFNRRDFLKLVGIGVAGTVAGCASPPADKLIPYLVQPTDVMPGVANWFASACTECPAGCGVLVKQREGRAIKLEGNAAHPVNRGGLCARGQAGLQGLYDPDRLKGPMLKSGGKWAPIEWADAMKLAGEKLGAARGKIALLTAHRPGAFNHLASEWASAAGGTRVTYEAFAHESLREANRRTFGAATVPNFDFGRARFVLALGADFLETWLSPVGHARGFAEMRGVTPGGAFVAVEPRLSATGANADEWVAIRPGGEMALALGMARVILSENLGPATPERSALLEATSPFTPEAVEQQTDVPAATVRRLAHAFARNRPSLAVAGGIASQSEQSVPMLAAVNLLNVAAGNVGETVRFDRTLNLDDVAPFGDVQKLVTAMDAGRVDALVVYEANPAYTAPAWAGFPAAMDKVGFKISLSSRLDETSERCDLLLPSAHALESWGDAQSVRGVYTLQQPGTRKLPMFDSHEAGGTLIALGKAAGWGAAWPDAWLDYVKAQWKPLHKRLGGARDFETFWADALKNGGVWEDVSATPVRWTGAPAFVPPATRGAGDLSLVLYPSPAFYDGRGANKPWLQELPDPTTKVVWGSWVEMHPATAAKLGVDNGDAVKVETDGGSIEAPAYLYSGIRKDTIAIPLGQGHTSYGRYAKDRGANAAALLTPAQDAASSAIAYAGNRARLSRSARAVSLSMTQQFKTQRDREIAQVIPIAALLGGAGSAGAKPEASTVSGSQSRLGQFTEPRELKAGETIPPHAVSAFVPEHPGRSPRAIPVREGSYANGKHRWAMAIDLNSCTGCSACIVACDAENNVPMVGPEMVKRGREMHWIRIERFEEKLGDGASDVRFVPMMCQHCGDAPCEIVCPVYATYHNPEGLNAQIYNRCVGTRYCSNNCPYKVRAFNWFDYSAPEKATFAFPEPLNWQLNPDVTVRSKGVMEKCTMCVQRILEGKGNARDEGRPLKDGEFTTACAQSCPTQAIVFGDLLDRESAVAKASYGERRYWVLEELNTKPGVTYRKRIQRAIEETA